MAVLTSINIQFPHRDSAHQELYTAHYTLYTAHYKLHMHTTRCTLHTECSWMYTGNFTYNSECGTLHNLQVHVNTITVVVQPQSVKCATMRRKLVTKDIFECRGEG